MRKILVISSLLVALVSFTDCKSMIYVAEGQTKGKVYATIVAPDGIFNPPKFYIAQCTHDGAKLNCSGEEVAVKIKN